MQDAWPLFCSTRLLAREGDFMHVRLDFLVQVHVVKVYSLNRPTALILQKGERNRMMMMMQGKKRIKRILGSIMLT